MSEIEYRKRTVSQLVSQVNNLGLNPSVSLKSIKLVAVPSLNVTQTKAFVNSKGQIFVSDLLGKKKFMYNGIHNNKMDYLGQLKQQMTLGFDCNLLLSPSRQKKKYIEQVITQLNYQEAVNITCVKLQQNNLINLFSQQNISFNQYQNRNIPFYSIQSTKIKPIITKIVKPQQKNIIIISILYKQALLNLILLSEQFFISNNNTFLGNMKFQIGQVLNCLKINPNQKYQQIQGIARKKNKATDVITNIILEDSSTIVVHFLQDNSYLNQKLIFFQKLRGLSILLKVKQYQFQVNALPSNFLSKQKLKKPQSDRPVLQKKQFEFCRSLQRKTHKYSLRDQQLQQNFGLTVKKGEILNIQQNIDPLFNFQASQKSNVNVGNQQQKIALLKSQHARQVSQYHWTIQQLNNKILALTQQKGLSQLYNIHQKQLMYLQLKIKELRQQISILCDDNDDKSLKSALRKANQQLKRVQAANSQKKIFASKVITLQKQLTLTKEELVKSQKIRKMLSYQLQQLTKRLKICDNQIQNLASAPVKSNEQEYNRSQTYQQWKRLLQSVAGGHVISMNLALKKAQNLSQQLKKSKQLVQECSDFLIQFQQQVQKKLGKTQPQIVLDCNKFARSFLMQTLNIF